MCLRDPQSRGGRQNRSQGQAAETADGQGLTPRGAESDLGSERSRPQKLTPLVQSAGLDSLRPLPRGMSENERIDSLRPGDELRLHGLRLGRGSIRTHVRCRSERFVICDYRVGGVNRHLIVDLEARTRRPAPGGRVGAQESTCWCRDLLGDLEAGRVPFSEVALPLDIVTPTPTS